MPASHGSPRAAFLESQEGVESLFTRGLREGARGAGWECALLFLRDRNHQRRPVSEIRDAIRRAQPSLVCFLMDAPIEWPELWDIDWLEKLPKLSFWFDDFYRSPNTLRFPKIWSRWQTQSKVRVFFWDGYWRARWQTFTGSPALPIHLAAGAFTNPRPPPAFPELRNHAVMLGTIPSIDSLTLEAQALPRVVQQLLTVCREEMKRAPWPLRPYELWETTLAEASPKMSFAARQWEQDPGRRALLCRQLWRWGKRITRLRGLAAAARGGPVAVFSGHHTEPFAGESEIRGELHLNGSFSFTRTTDLPSAQWPALFRSGCFQLQFMDPQSIEGGIPFRVFETAACGAPLLSDSRPEMASILSAPEECALAHGEDELERECLRLRNLHQEERRRLGENAHRRFLLHHTWTHRWREILAAAIPAP